MIVQAFENATLNVTSVAASAATNASVFGKSISGGGAIATNTLANTTEAYVESSTLTSFRDLTVEARDISTSSAKVDSASVAAGILSLSAGGSVATTT